MIDPLPEILAIATGNAEACALAINKLASLQALVRERKALLESALIEWIDHHGGELVVGDIRYYVGTKRSTKCKSKPATLQAILEANGGDLEAVCDHMASEPWKYGGLKELLGDKWGECFEVISEPDLKEGIAVRRLQSINTRFLR